MAKKCDLCGRGPKSANQRSHSNIATKRKQNLNLKKTTVQGKSKKICTKCLKSLYR